MVAKAGSVHSQRTGREGPGHTHNSNILYTSRTLVSFPDPTTHARKESGDIGADSWFCKLSNHVIICIDLYWRTCGHVMVRKTKKALQCPQTLSLLRVGSGNETTRTPVLNQVLTDHWKPTIPR